MLPARDTPSTHARKGPFLSIDSNVHEGVPSEEDMHVLINLDKTAQHFGAIVYCHKRGTHAECINIWTKRKPYKVVCPGYDWDTVEMALLTAEPAELAGRVALSCKPPQVPFQRQKGDPGSNVCWKGRGILQSPHPQGAWRVPRIEDSDGGADREARKTLLVKAASSLGVHAGMAHKRPH